MYRLQTSVDVSAGMMHSVRGFVCRAIKKNQLWCVVTGQLYYNRQMPAERMVQVCQKANIRTVVDLRKKHRPVEIERQAMVHAGITHVHLPSEQIPAQGVIDHFLELIHKPQNLPIALHCKHGVGRTGVIVGIFLIEKHGYSNDQARRHARRIGGIHSFSRQRAKGRFLLNYTPSLASAK